jgi:DNA-binding XRE family transcriptional regulator
MNKKTCNAADLYITKKLHERRIELKMKQIELTKALDIAS